MIQKQLALVEKLMSGEGVLKRTEAVVVEVFTYTEAIIEAKDFQIMFDDGFDAEFVAERFDRIGHRMAASTIRLAHRIACTLPCDHTLEFLAYAFCQMEITILQKLEAYEKEHGMYGL